MSSRRDLNREEEDPRAKMDLRQHGLVVAATRSMNHAPCWSTIVAQGVTLKPDAGHRRSNLDRSSASRTSIACFPRCSFMGCSSQE
jgi:hypothetical protein